MSENLSAATGKLGLPTAQQWAWQFLRRNPEYAAAYQLVATLTHEQSRQLSFLIAQQQNLLPYKGLVELEIIRTLDLRFFEVELLECFNENMSETVGQYIDRTRKIEHLDEKIELSVSKQFWLETYCLKDWIDPVNLLEFDASTAKGLWVHTPIVEAGLVNTSNFGLLSINGAGFRSLRKDGRRSAESSMQVETKFPIVGDVDDNMSIRSATVWGYNYQTPMLEFSQVDIRFDLNLPLAFQIKNAQAELKERQDLLIKAKILDRYPKQVDKHGVYEEYLMVLDRLNAGATSMMIAVEMEQLVQKNVKTYNKKLKKFDSVKIVRDPKNPHAGNEKLTEKVRQKIVRALRLRDHDYKALAFL